MYKSVVPAVFGVFFAILTVCSSENVYTINGKQSGSNAFDSAIMFPVKGSVYPLGYFSVSMTVGYPPKFFDMDVDTGSDLTWVQCDAPCTGCTLPRYQLYKLHNNAVNCVDPLCAALNSPNKPPPCENPTRKCAYEIEYAEGSSSGLLVKDLVPIRFINGSVSAPTLGFGCGFNQKSGPHSPSSTGGVLGLGNGKVAILSQLSALGHVRNVIGHCLSGQGGGFLFLGGGLVPPSGITWTPLSRTRRNHLSAGPAEVYFGGKAAGIRGLTLDFDSGSSYSYFNSQVYGAILNLIKNDLKGKPLREAPEDKTLNLCWKGTKAFRSVVEATKIFKPLALSFTNSRNVQFQIPPEAYLIVSQNGNLCLGIFNGAEVGLGNLNIIGAISMLDKLVIYDYERQQIGWTSANCNWRPRN